MMSSLCTRLLPQQYTNKVLPLMKQLLHLHVGFNLTWSKFLCSDTNSEALRKLDEENDFLFGPPLIKKEAEQKVKIDNRTPSQRCSDSHNKTNSCVGDDSNYFEPESDSSESTSKDAADLRNILLYPLLDPDKENENNSSVIDLPHVFKMPSVTKILSDTMPPESRYFLDKWEQEQIAKLGLEGFQKLKRETFEKGENLHKCIESYMKGVSESDLGLSSANEGHWNSLKGVFPHITDLVLSEAHVKHPHLGYHGYFDCIAHYKNELCLFEWKTSKKQKARLEWTYDNPLQVAAYLGAINADDNYSYKLKSGVLVIAYEDGSPAHVHRMDVNVCQRYWQAWLKRLLQYWRGITPQTSGS